jgi:hypothetical protein
MRKLFLTAILGLTMSAAAATNETAVLLKAHRVPHALYIRVSGSGLEYAIDAPTNFLTLQEGDTFTGQAQVDFAYPEFNPFEIKIETSEDLRDDPTSAAVAAFLQKVLDTAGTVLPKPPESQTAAATEEANRLGGAFRVQTKDLWVLRTAVEASKPSNDPCSKYEEFHSALFQLRTKMNAEIVTKEDARQWVTLAKNATGVGTVRESIMKKITDIDDNEDAIIALLKSINEKFGASGSDPAEMKCGEIRASTLAALLDISQLATKARARNLTVRSNLKDLHKALEPFADGTRWRDTTSFIFLKPAIDPAKVDAINVKVSKRVIDKEKLTFTDGDPVKKKLDLRQYQRIIPEVAAAIIYTDLTYPTWGTDKDGEGRTIVAPGKPASFPVQGAMVLNGVLPVGIATLYPAIQFGVSTAKEFPGFLAGVALRSVGTKQFSLSFGKMLTWYRTLDKLKPGSIVNGTADIEKDMKLKRAPLAWYGGVQYSF